MFARIEKHLVLKFKNRRNQPARLELSLPEETANAANSCGV
ncbi:hypothetical protein [Neomoorella mulderi]|nr:hypothetical protein [Moorella mulderi]